MLSAKANRILLEFVPELKINFQSVRFRLRHKVKEPFRKPVWQPIAPSKLYRIKKKEELSQTEREQRQHLEYTYEINMKSIKQFLHDEFYAPTVVQSETGQTTNVDDVIDEEEFQKALQANQEENAKIAKMRDERMREFKKDLQANLLAQKIEKEEQDRRIGEEFDRLVRIEIERSKTYITKENLDAKIEEALTHQTDYDYAIDVNGRLVFDGALHPYALRPKAVPETSSQTDESLNIDPSKPIYVKAKKLF